MHKCEIRVYNIKEDSNDEILLIKEYIPKDSNIYKVIVVDLGTDSPYKNYEVLEAINRFKLCEESVAVILVFAVTEETMKYPDVRTIIGVTFNKIYTKYTEHNIAEKHYYSSLMINPNIFNNKFKAMMRHTFDSTDIRSLFSKLSYDNALQIITDLLKEYYLEES